MSENTTPPSTPPPPPNPPSKFSVELMTTETFNLGEAAVGVADLFEGTNPPVEFLTKRAGDMLRANPWLAGRLKTVEGQPHLARRLGRRRLGCRLGGLDSWPSRRRVLTSRPTRRAPPPVDGRGAP